MRFPLSRRRDGSPVVPAPSNRRSRLRRVTATAALAGTIAAVGSGNASAVLILLDGDTLDVQGTINQDVVYIDGKLRIIGDLAINAQTVYFGPSADVRTCAAVDPPPDNDPPPDDVCPNGRNIAITATNSIAIAPSRFGQPLDLTKADSLPAPGAGGSLALSAPEIIVGRDVDVRGIGAPSGNVAISATGRVETRAIFAPGGTIRIVGNGGVMVSGNLCTKTTDNCDPFFGGLQIPSAVAGQQPSAGPIEISSAGGDVTITGSVLTDGRSAGAAGGAGGNGGPVAIVGGDVRVGPIDVTGGNSTDAAPGAFGGTAGAVGITGRGSVHVLGAADASGSSSTAASASPGSTIDIVAGGHVVLTDARVAGANGPLGGGGSAAGRLTISGASAVLGSIQAFGGNATNPGSGTFGNGGNGGLVKITAAGSVKLGSSTNVDGGDVASPGSAGALGGAGGTVEVTAGDLVTGNVSAEGGSAPQGAGVGGGAIRLLSANNLMTGGVVSTLGSDGTGSADPGRNGGPGGPVVLRASAGVLTIGGTVRSSGGAGGQSLTDGQRGGQGGSAAPIEVVALTIGNVGTVLAEGGDGGDFGDDQGPGGNGAEIRLWSDSQLFDDKKVVSTSGGDGQPAGTDGPKTQQFGPSSLTLLTDGSLSFTSRSPGAQGFRILRSIAGGAAEVFYEGTQTSGIKAAGPMCQPVTFTAYAFNSAVGWVSTGSQPVSYTAQPSATQTCNQVPTLTAKKSALKPTLANLKKAKWRLTIPITSSGIATKLSYKLMGTKLVKPKKKGKKPARVAVTLLTVDPAAVPVPGANKLVIALPTGARKRGFYTILLVATAPDNTTTATTKLTLEVR